MSRGKSEAAKQRNHQWQRNEPLDELWFSRLGHRPNESLYEAADSRVPPAPLLLGHLPVLPLAAVVGTALLESRVHALVGAMAAFTSSSFGQRTMRPMWNGPTFVPDSVTSPGTYPSAFR